MSARYWSEVDESRRESAAIIAGAADLVDEDDDHDDDCPGDDCDSESCDCPCHAAGICRHCSGTGDSKYGGLSCNYCGGTGEAPTEDDLLRQDREEARQEDLWDAEREERGR